MRLHGHTFRKLSASFRPDSPEMEEKGFGVCENGHELHLGNHVDLYNLHFNWRTAVDPSKVQELDGKVFETSGLNIVERYRHRDYELVPHDNATLKLTGRLDIFELRPNSPGRPSFVARWDGGSRRWGKARYDLDIDIRDVSKGEEARFKKGKDGYSGHHSKRIPAENAWTYEVSVGIPGERIFDATVSLHTHRRLGLQAGIFTTATLDAVLIKADGTRRDLGRLSGPEEHLGTLQRAASLIERIPILGMFTKRHQD